MQKLTEQFYAEVTGVSRESRYLEGYGKPPTIYTALSIKAGQNSQDGGPLRTCVITMPGDLPIGTRFKVSIEQMDEVTAATIHRGALPEIGDRKLIEGGGSAGGGTGEVQ